MFTLTWVTSAICIWTAVRGLNLEELEDRLESNGELDLEDRFGLTK